MIFEGISRTIKRPPADGDVTVAAYICRVEGEIDRLVRIGGLDGCDYLQPMEARALARALDAVADELAAPG